MAKELLNNFLSQLDLLETVFLKNHDGSYATILHFDIQNKLNLIQPDAIYVFNNQPLILFFDLTDNIDIQRENDIHKKVWSFDNSPIIFVIKNTEIKVYNALNYIKKDNSLEEIHLTESQIKEKFSFWNLQSNSVWEWFQKEYISNKQKKETQKRVNDRLFQNIKDVRTALIDKKNDPEGSIPNSLILKLIFIRYLIDRGIEIDREFIKGEDQHSRRLSFSKLMQNGEKLCMLFTMLNDRFNGVLFKDIDIKLTTSQVEDLSKVFSGEIPEKDSLFYGIDFYFDIFDFSIIPVEVISGIYESLIDPETRNLQSAVYTPSFLVEYILNDTIDIFLKENKSSECKIFDVAVGSGIFLVQSLRKMIEKEIELNGNSDKKAFSKRIRNIAKNNLYGIDINREALKVTCFSIYIALLDYQEPKDINIYKFPNLLNENLFEANFFDTTHPFNDLIQKEKPEYILGNPPWKSNKDVFHLKWLEQNKKIVGRFEIAQSFLLRTKDFMNHSTKVALIITSTIFYNVSKTTRKFKKEFLTTYCIDKFLDLSPVRRLIFQEKDSPASVVYYRLSKDCDYLNNVINHQSVKINYFLKNFKMLVIEKFDDKSISQHYFIENDWMFKIALYGNILDFNLFQKLHKSKMNILDLIDNQTVFAGAGIERGKSPTFFPELMNLPIVENSQIKQDYTKVDSYKLLSSKDVYLSRGRNRNIFIGHKILFKEQNLNETEPVISYTDEDCVFRKGIFSISSAQRNIIQYLYTYLKSDLYTYFLYLKSAAWGVATRPAIRFNEEFLSFPYIEPAPQDEKYLLTLFGEFLKSYVNFDEDIGSRKSCKDTSILVKINDFINKLYSIEDYEKDLIDYVLNVSRYQFQESKQNLAIEFSNEIGNRRNRDFVLNNYAQIFIREFGNIYNDEYIQVEIYPLNHFIAMNFVFHEIEVEEKIIYKKNNLNETEVLKKLANDLTIWQITNTADPTNNLFIQKDIKGFEKNSFYIIKPNEYKCWHQAIAWYDIAEFKAKIEDAELDNLNDTINE